MARKAKKRSISFWMKAFKWIAGGIFLIFLVLFFYNSGLNYLRHSPLFEVREIVKSPALSFIHSRHLQRLIGRNLFAVDLRRVQQQLQLQYPHIDRLRIVREFPNRLCLRAETRDPLAWFQVAGKKVLLDKTATALPDQGTTKDLPEIRGISEEPRLVLGKPLNNERARIALDIIQEINQNKYLHPYPVQAVDMQHLSKIGVFLTVSSFPLVKDHLYVLMDRDRISKKVQTLGILLSQGNLKTTEIKYIDLRFKEPILAQR